jgi:hypothetical protein
MTHRVDAQEAGAMTVFGERVGQTLNFARQGMLEFERKVNQLDKRAEDALKGAQARIGEVRALVPRPVESIGGALFAALQSRFVTRDEFAELASKLDALTGKVEALAKKQQRKPSAHA